MGAVNIPNTFASGEVISSTKVNENFTAITAQVNGNLDITNIAANAITPTQINAAAVETDKIKDEAVTGAKTVLAATNSTRGSMLHKSGTITVAGGATSAAITFTGTAFSTTVPPIIKLMRSTKADNLDPAFIFSDLDANNTTFTITNGTAVSIDFIWVAIGI